MHIVVYDNPHFAPPIDSYTKHKIVETLVFKGLGCGQGFTQEYCNGVFNYQAEIIDIDRGVEGSQERERVVKKDFNIIVEPLPLEQGETIELIATYENQTDGNNICQSLGVKLSLDMDEVGNFFWSISALSQEANLLVGYDGNHLLFSGSELRYKNQIRQLADIWLKNGFGVSKFDVYFSRLHSTWFISKVVDKYYLVDIGVLLNYPSESHPQGSVEGTLSYYY